MIEMYRAWASGLPPAPFPTFVPANTLSLPPKLQSQFLTVVDTSQHAVESISCQMHPNASASHSLASQYKPTTFIAPHTVCAFIAQPSTEASTLPINPTVVLPQSASGPMFKALDDHCYTLEPTFKLRGNPKFLTKKPRIPEKSKKMVGKVKSVENDMESFLGLVGDALPCFDNLSNIGKEMHFLDWEPSQSIGRINGKPSNKLTGAEATQNLRTDLNLISIPSILVGFRFGFSYSHYCQFEVGVGPSESDLDLLVLLFSVLSWNGSSLLKLVGASFEPVTVHPNDHSIICR
ncbi:hypothetical protein FXO38_30677 [Capsicum annuum]|nr:hypothetical protein FXO38_30677 [Capsicum annuum]